MTTTLIQVRGEKEWRSYHAIRRVVLFESRGRSDYDDTRADERRPGVMPLLFLKDAVPVGTVRLDVEEGAGAGTIRLVAILPAYQRQGLGRAMIGGVEGLAVDMGVTKLRVHAAPDAIGFYEKLGWGLAGSATPRPLLVKRLKAG